MSKTSKTLTVLIGLFMLVTGLLKFVNPFKSWYQSQVLFSELPFADLTYWAGQLGEILIGVVLLLPLLSKAYEISVSQGKFKMYFMGANVVVIVMMLVACYVHMHPNVPNEVLPLKIKPPVIPLLFVLMAVFNSISLYRGKS